MRISKRQIIEALKKEPRLQQGQWVVADAHPDIGECGVCAVGATLRHAAKLPNNVLDAYVGKAGISGNVWSREKSMKEGDWLSILSDVFESEEHGGDDEIAKAAALKFVKEKFPTHIELDDDLLEEAKEEARKHLLSCADRWGILRKLRLSKKIRSDSYDFKYNKKELRLITKAVFKATVELDKKNRDPEMEIDAL